ncbi:MAG: hypothetical protein RIC87_18030 [Kiloniellales bacterium]
MAERLDGRRLVRDVGLAALVVLAVVACQQQPLPGVDPTPPRASPPPAGSSQSAPPLTVTGESAIPDKVVQEDASGWVSQGTSPDQHQADLQSCYSFANAQVRHDEQIDDDRGSLFGSNNAARAGNLYSYQRAIRPYGSEQRFEELFRNCMASRGYQQN